MLKAQTQLPAQVVRVAAQMEQKKEILELQGQTIQAVAVGVVILLAVMEDQVLLFCVIQVA
jgi:hypothetical protein